MKRSSIVNVWGLIALLSVLAACSGGPASSVQESAAPAQPAASAQPAPYFEGDGGEGIRIAVWLPDAKGLARDEEWLPAMVQGTLTGDFNKYSKMTVTDRQNLEKILAEQIISASGNFSENDYVRMGELVNAQYILTGSITKTGADGFLLELSVSDASTGVRKASYPPKPCRLSELANMTAIKAASENLLAQMGVTLTDAGREALRGVKGREAEAEVTLSKGIIAQKSGTVVEALSYYIQATNYDPSATEAASRLNILSADITSGNMGANVRNDIQWRRQWVERLTEAEQFYANHVKEPTPYYIVYDTNLQQGKIDYVNETVPIGFTVDLVPDAHWIETAVKVINTVQAGLLATGRTEDWGLEWPKKSVSSVSPFVKRDENFTVAVELMNDKGATIGRQNITLQGGWDIDNKTTLLKIDPRIKDPRKAEFPLVNANSITDTLAIRIVSINGTSAETAARNRRINIVTEADYAKLPDVVAGTDSRSVIKQVKEFTLEFHGSSREVSLPAYGRETPKKVVIPPGYSVEEYRGNSEHVVIPADIFGIPVVRIGRRAFSTNRSYVNPHGAALITGVIIPNGVSYIGNEAFTGNNLTGVIIPNSVTYIGEGAFSGNNLTGVIIPNSVIYIGEGAFRDNKLTGVIVPSSVTDIGQWVFSGNPLTSLTIPANSAVFRDDEFEIFYFRNGKKAGTYTKTKTRPNADSSHSSLWTSLWKALTDTGDDSDDSSKWTYQP